MGGGGYCRGILLFGSLYIKGSPFFLSPHMLALKLNATLKP